MGIEDQARTMTVDLQFAMRHAEATRNWVVVVCPKVILKACRAIFTGVVPASASFSGRTACLPNGGKLSVVYPQDLFMAPGQDFSVLFTGWSGQAPKDLADLKPWRTQAKQCLQADES